MRIPLVAGNWKLNGSLSGNKQLVEGLMKGLSGQSADVVICPPSVYLDQVVRLSGSNLEVGAQNVCDATEGAYTGEVSALMLHELGVKWAIIGHSERRTLYLESDKQIANRFKTAACNGVNPILCVGETLEQREQGNTQAVITQQLDAVLEITQVQDWTQAVIAYEPVWAIGTGKTASPLEAQEVHEFIRQKIAGQLGDEISQTIRIVYGGSVKPANAAELFEQADIDGGLIGGASLKADDFLAIINAAK